MGHQCHEFNKETDASSKQSHEFSKERGLSVVDCLSFRGCASKGIFGSLNAPHTSEDTKNRDKPLTIHSSTGNQRAPS
jgi:hypothetical protein